MQAFKEEIVNPYTNTSDWTEVHYLARFMYHALRHNTRHIDGLFKNRALRPREAETLIWSVLKAIQHLHAPSQINRPSGGRALLDDRFNPKVSQKRTARNIPRTKKRFKKGSEQNPFANGPGEGLILEDSTPPMNNASPNDTAAWEEDAGQVENLFDIVSQTMSESWKMMIKSYGPEEYPTKKSSKFDPADPYWQLMFARTALQHAEIYEASDWTVRDVQDTPSDAISASGHQAGVEKHGCPWSSGDPHADADEVQEIRQPVELAYEPIDGDRETFLDLKYLQADEVASMRADEESEQVPPSYLMTVTEDSLKLYRNQLWWMDNSQYQPHDFDAAVSQMDLTAPEDDEVSTIKIRHRYMRSNCSLEPWQVLGVARLLEIREARQNDVPLSTGAFLGDVMGLGKTYQAIVYMLEVSAKPSGVKYFRNLFSSDPE